jgi:hypothetical protein
MLEVEKDCVVPLPDDELVLDAEEPVAELVVFVFPPIVVDEVTLPPPAVTVVEVLPLGKLLLSMIVHVPPSSSFIVSAASSLQNRGNAAIKIFGFMSYLQEGASRANAAGRQLVFNKSRCSSWLCREGTSCLKRHPEQRLPHFLQCRPSCLPFPYRLMCHPFRAWKQHRSPRPSL